MQPPTRKGRGFLLFTGGAASSQDEGAREMFEKIPRWSRWQKYGVLSGIIAIGAIAIALFSSSPLMLIMMPIMVPTLLLNKLPIPPFPFISFLTIVLAISLWGVIGAGIGVVIEKLGGKHHHGALLWLIAYFTLAAAYLLYDRLLWMP
jgi:hypothetical protein